MLTVSKTQFWLLKQQWVTKSNFWAPGSDNPPEVSLLIVKYCSPCMTCARDVHVAIIKRQADCPFQVLRIFLYCSPSVQGREAYLFNKFLLNNYYIPDTTTSRHWGDSDKQDKVPFSHGTYVSCKRREKINKHTTLSKQTPKEAVYQEGLSPFWMLWQQERADKDRPMRIITNIKRTLETILHSTLVILSLIRRISFKGCFN